jgi:hypothetical protein
MLPKHSTAGVERRFSARAQGDFPVRIGDGLMAYSDARGVDVSATGVLIARVRPLASNEDRLYFAIEMTLPDTGESITVLARPVWTSGPYQALKFIRMNDVDRLSIAEHVDRAGRTAA